MKQLVMLILLLLSLAGFRKGKDTITIHTIGDSTMADKKPEVFPETGWCQVLGEHFKNRVTVRNYAVNGRSSKSFIDEGRWKEVWNNLKEGDYVFIQFGHNDQKENDKARFTTPFGTYKENLELFITQSLEKKAVPVLFTPIVRRKFSENGLLTDTHGEYPEAVRQVAEEQNVVLIDLEKLTEKWINDLGDEPSKKMFLYTCPDEKFPEGRKDDTHLSWEGAEKVAILAMEECRRRRLAFTRHLKKDY